MRQKSPFLEVAMIINTHGVTGELKLDPWCDTPEILKNIPEFIIDGKSYAVKSARVASGRFVLAKLEGIDDLDKAMKFKGKKVLAGREHIKKPEGSHFIADLIGLSVIDAGSGRVYGVLEDVECPSVQEIFRIRTDSGKEVLMPNVPAFVKKVDEENGIFIEPIEGLFDTEDV